MKKGEKIELTNEELEKVITTTVLNTLTHLGIESAEPNEMQKDFVLLRNLRKSTDAVKQKGIISAFGFIILSIAAFGYSSITSMFGGGGG